MAGASLLTLLDDIATLLDDVSVLSKVALKKTTGVLGDDLALNAEQVSGVRADRELPVVWAVAKGSFLNKLILVPSALFISALFPWLITPLLMIGGAYLCYEGTEKVLHSLFHKQQAAAEKQQLKQAFHNKQVDMKAFEAKKIKGAIRTDFILSAEIIVITLGTVQDASLLKQTLVLSAIAVAITIFIYGLVAGIVKLDDAGIACMKYQGQNLADRFRRVIGRGLLWFAPKLMKLLAVAGTIAMFLVGGGILVHGLHFVAVWHDMLIQWLTSAINIGQYLTPLVRFLLVMISGFVAGLIIIPVVNWVTGLIEKLKKR